MLLLFVVACGNVHQHASSDDLQEAQAHYDSGFVRLQQDSMMGAFPYFIQVAQKLEYLPEDMTNEEKLLASRAYYQMAFGERWPTTLKSMPCDGHWHTSVWFKTLLG